MIIKKFLNKYRDWLIQHRTSMTIAPRLNTLECNRKIAEALRSKKPFFVGRIGATEGVTIGRLITQGSIPEKIKDQLYSAIFPPTDEEVEKFLEIYLAVLDQPDILAVLPKPYHGWIAKTYVPRAPHVDFHSIEPFFCEEPWSAALEGLNVLVVHPFTESILKQYSTAREKLFKNPNMLPEFHLKTIKAPQTFYGCNEGFNSWSETLEYLKQKVHQCKQDFDVAIIGCGPYGFPLAAEVKKMGKMALHLGGVSQLLFGIKGRRWQIEQPRYLSIMTDAWRSPAENERPKGWEKMEGGCYW